MFGACTLESGYKQQWIIQFNKQNKSKPWYFYINISYGYNFEDIKILKLSNSKLMDQRDSWTVYISIF